MDTFQFDLVTPEATFYSGPAAQVEAPGTLGDFGILPGHMNFISTLRPGVIAVHSAEGVISRIFVASGIAEVNPVSCTILAERVVDLTKLSREDAEKRLAAARATLDNSFDDHAKEQAAREMELAEAILLAMGQQA